MSEKKEIRCMMCGSKGGQPFEERLIEEISRLKAEKKLWKRKYDELIQRWNKECI